MSATLPPTTDLRLRAYAQVLLRHKLAIMLVTLVVVLLGVVPALTEDSLYGSVTEMRVRAEDADSPFVSDDRSDNPQNRSRDLVSEVQVLESARMRGLVIERLGPDAEPFNQVSATLLGFSEIIVVYVTAPTPEAAANAANAYADVFVEERQRQSIEPIVAQVNELRRRIDEATDEVAAIDSELASEDIDPVRAENLRSTRSGLTMQILEFSNSADVLDVEIALRRGGTEIVTRAALFLDPVSPKPFRSGLTALVLGLLAGVAVAVLLEVLQDKLSDTDDLAAIDPTVPVLGSIPHLERAGADAASLAPASKEAFKYVRTSLQFRAAEQAITSVVVTSAMSSEGKTTTALHLAMALSETGGRVMLLDADLRRPAVHTRLDLDASPGLTDLLSGEASFADAVHYVSPTLAVLTAGSPSKDANELIGSEEFAKLVTRAASQCDVLVIDVPPVLPVADPLVVAKLVDATVVVARVGQVRRKELRSLISRFRDAHLPIIGFVANDSEAGSQYGEYVSDAKA